MSTWLVRIVTTRARWVLAVGAVALIAAVAVGTGAFGRLQAGGFEDPAAESVQARESIARYFGGDPDLVLVIEAADGVDSPAARATADALARDLRAEPDLADVVSYWETGAPSLVSPDRRTALVVADVLGTESDVAGRAGGIVERHADPDDGDGVRVLAGGQAAVMADVTARVGSDLLRAELIAVPLIMVLLVVVFGSLTAALLPLLVGGAAVGGTFALLAVLGAGTDVSIYAINLTTALGLGLGIDYALFMVSRFREELHGGADPATAVGIAITTAGRTILFSGATIAVALLALLPFPQYFLRSFAYAGIGVVVLAVIGSLVLLPAVLTLLGHRVDAGRLRRARPSTVAPFWGRLAGLVMRRPVLTAVPVLVLLAVAALPLLRVEFGNPDDRVLPTTAQSREAGDLLRAQFPAVSGAIEVITTGPVERPAVASYATTLAALPGVQRVESGVGVVVAGADEPVATPADARYSSPEAQRLVVVTGADPRSTEAADLVAAVRAVLGPGERTDVGGPAAELVDSTDAIGDRLPTAVAMIIVSTLVLLFLFTGSVWQPVRALLLGSLGLAATLGVLVLVFQQGWFAGVLGFTPLPLDTSMVVLLLVIAFGLSMDYEVFVLSRIVERHRLGDGLIEAVTTGLSRTGRIVSAAASLLAVSFFAFGTADVSFIQMFGIGSGLAILIDATLIRGVLVPAAMRVLGRAAWWSPKPLRLLHDRVGISEHARAAN